MEGERGKRGEERGIEIGGEREEVGGSVGKIN